MEKVKVPQEVYEGLNVVRKSGRANMADADGVQIAANDLECYALVVWVEENRGSGKLGMGCFVGFEPADELSV